ncbi:outer membrane beta-barrel protein [Helicobacter bizzozeronii]|uniref:outer membrane beta-barrel protein n=1 Tax=Helicobacter bizzozeronii TaxID=56877 RepID=UPI000CF055FF|nr:outer membrane beta-barrel protein [Helicobacter bizzozeronii]
MNSVIYQTPSTGGTLTNTGSIFAGGSSATGVVGSQGANYTVSANALDALSAINTLNGLISGGIATGAAATTAALNANATSVATAVSTFDTNYKVILNNTYNVSDPAGTGVPSTASSLGGDVSAVITALAGLGITGDYKDASGDDQGKINAALQGLVNPQSYGLVWDAYENISSSLIGGSNIASAFTALQNTKLTGPQLAVAVFDQLLKASQAIGEIQTAGTNIDKLGASTAATGVFGSSTFGGSGAALNGAALQNIYKMLNGDSSAYSTFTSAYSGLQQLIQDTLQTSSSTTTTTTQGTTNNATTQYPAYIGNGNTTTPTTPSAAASGKPLVQSIYSASLDNTQNQQLALNKALATLLGQAASYAGNVYTLNAGLTSTAQGNGTLGNILGSAINNAAANAQLNNGAANAAAGTGDAINTQATIYNDISAALKAHTLLDDYINALTNTAMGNSIGNQTAYASALNYLYDALNANPTGNAKQSNNVGLIQNTIANIENTLTGGNVITPEVSGTKGTFTLGGATQTGGYTLSNIESVLGIPNGALNNTATGFNYSTADQTAANWDDVQKGLVNALVGASGSGGLVGDVGTLQSYFASASAANVESTTVAGVKDAQTLAGLLGASGDGTAGSLSLTALQDSGLEVEWNGTTYKGSGGSDPLTMEVFYEALADLVAKNGIIADTFKNIVALNAGGTATLVQDILSLTGYNKALAADTTASNTAPGAGGAQSLIAAYNSLTTATAGGANTIGTITAKQIQTLVSDATSKVIASANTINGLLSTGSQVSDWKDDAGIAKALIDANAGNWKTTLEGGDYKNGTASTPAVTGPDASTAFSNAVSTEGVAQAIASLQSQVNTAMQVLQDQQAVVYGQNGSVELNSAVTSSLLGTGTGGLNVSNANMGAASAAVNSLSNALQDLGEVLSGVGSSYNQSDAQTINSISSAISSLTASTTSNGQTTSALSNLGTQLTAFNTQTQALASDSFFGSAATIANTSNVSTGIGAGNVGGNFSTNANASNYITGLQNISTIVGYIGNIASASGANPNYTTAFVTNTPVAIIASNIGAITGGLAKGVTEVQVIQALEAITGGSDSSSLDSLYTSGSTAATRALNAWNAIANASKGQQSLLQTLNSALTSGNQVSGLTLSSTSATSAQAQGVQSLLNIAGKLNTAMTALAGATAVGNNTGVASGFANNNLLNITDKNASTFVTAQNVAAALNTLEQTLSSVAASGADVTSADNVIAAIQALNTYAQNQQVLQALAGSNAATDAVANIEAKISAIMGAAASSLPKNLVGVSNSQNTTATLQASLQQLQNLINRYNYLQGLSQQVSDAINSNPVALLNAYNNSATSTSYQNAMGSLAKVLNTYELNNFGSVVTSGNNKGNYAANGNLNAQTLANINNLITANEGNLSAWNTFVKDNSSAEDNLGSLAASANSLASLYNGVSTTGMGSLASALSNVNNALDAPTSTTNKTPILAGSVFNIASAPAGALTGAYLDDPILNAKGVATSTTLLGAFQAINTLNNMVDGTLAGKDASTTLTTISDAMTTLNGASNNGSVDTLLSTFTNAVGANSSAGIGANFVPDTLNALGQGSGNNSASNVVGALANALNQGSLRQYFLESNPTSLPSAGSKDAQTLAAQVQTAISGIVGSANAQTITATNVVSFMQAAQNISQAVNKLVDVTNISTSNPTQAFNNAVKLFDAYTTAQSALSKGNTLSGLSSAQLNVIANAVSAASAFSSGANQVGAIASDMNGLLTETINGTAVGSLTVGDLGTQPAGLAGLVAQALVDAQLANAQTNGQAPNPNLDSLTLTQLISAATPTQLQAAITSVINSAAFQNNPTFQQQLLAQIISQGVGQTADYQAALSALGSLGTNAQTTALNNANSVQALSKVLKASTISDGAISADELQAIKTALSGIQNAAGTIIAFNGDTAAAQQAKVYLGAQQNNTASSDAYSTLIAAANNGVTTSGAALKAAATTYLESQNNSKNGVLFVQALATAQSNQFASILGSLQQASEQSGTLATAYAALAGNSNFDNPTVANGIDNLNNAIQDLYKTIYGSKAQQFSAVQVQAQLGNLINQITSLQGQVLDAMIGLGNEVYGKSAQPMVKGGLVSYLKGGFAQTNLTQGERQALMTQYAALLKALGDTKALALASKLKYDGNANVLTALALAKQARPTQLSTQNGNMYGINVQFGYKQFFGKKKRWGLRYYASFSYQHGTFNVSDAGDVDNFVYGAGVDALYNFYESKDGNQTSGIFAGLMLAGSTWNAKNTSFYKALLNGGGWTGKMNTSYFQVPINIGFRTNVNRHNGFEIGLRIPLATNYFFNGSNAQGEDLKIAYKRNISVFFNYVYNF